MLVFLVFYHFCWERSWLSFCSFEIICLFLWLLRFSLSFHNFTKIFSWLGFILCEIYCISWIYGWISFNNLEKFKVIISSNIAYAPFSHFFTHTHTHTHTRFLPHSPQFLCSYLHFVLTCFSVLVNFFF